MEIEITATYDRDSRRYHRFLVDDGQKIKGAVYLPKSEPVPDTVTILLKTKGGDQKQ